MPTSFSAPNPYGSFFSFTDVNNAAATAGLIPGRYQGLSPGTSAAMGGGSGGFNPSTDEYWRQQEQQRRNSQLQAYVAQRDARSPAVTSTILSTLFQGDQKKINAFANKLGGQQSMNEMFSYMLNSQVGASLTGGGSHFSLGMGAQAIATSGMNFGGHGMFGDGAAQSQAARAVFNHVNRAFYGATGAAKLSATQGLNRDQIGGIMSIGASQGAFGGMEAGKIHQLDGVAQFTMNPATIAKIEKFTKNAAKSISSLIDVYGSASMKELVDKAQQITGMDLSRVDNAEIMNSRLQRLRAAALSTGTDTQSMYDLAARSTSMGMQMGLRSEHAGTIGTVAAIAGREDYVRQQTHQRSSYTASTSQEEFVRGRTADMVQMARDPVGSRRMAVELMIQNGVIGKSEEAAVREAMGKAGPGNMGGMDNAVMRATGGKFSSMSYMRLMGGAQSVHDMLDPKNAYTANEGNASDLHNRKLGNITRVAQSLTGSRGSGTTLAGLVNDLGQSTIQSALEAADGGASDAALMKIINADDKGRLNPNHYLSAIKLFKGGLKSGTAASVHASLRSHMAVSAGTKGFTSVSDDMQEVLRSESKYQMAESDRGLMTMKMGDKLMQGFLERKDHQDPVSRFAALAFASPDAVAGVAGNIHLKGSDYLDSNGVVKGKKLDALKESLTALRDSSLSSKDEILDRLGIPKHLDISNVNSTLGTKIAQRLEDPLERRKIFKGTQVLTGVKDGREYSQLASEANLQDTKAIMSGIQLARIVDSMHKAGADNPEIDLLQSRAHMMQKGYVNHYEGGISKSTGQNPLTSAQRENQIAITGKAMADMQVSGKLSEETLNQISSNKALGTAFATALAEKTNLSSKDDMTAENYTPGGKRFGKSEQSRSQHALELLAKAGIKPDAGANAGNQLIEGTIKLMGDGTLKFMTQIMAGKTPKK